MPAARLVCQNVTVVEQMDFTPETGQLVEAPNGFTYKVLDELPVARHISNGTFLAGKWMNVLKVERVDPKK